MVSRELGNRSLQGKPTHLESEVAVSTVEKVSFLGLLKVLVLPAFCSALAGGPGRLSVRCSFQREASDGTYSRAAPPVWSPWRGGLSPRQNVGIPGPASKTVTRLSGPLTLASGVRTSALSQPGAWNSVGVQIPLH